MIDNQIVLKKAMLWMMGRGWKNKLAKAHAFNQSLFDHTLIELDVMLQILPILRQSNHFGLSPEEELVLIASIVAHDVGKERPDWQDYVRGKRSFVSDVEPDITKNILPELCAALGFVELGQQIMPIIENCVNLHMGHERHASNMVMAIMQGSDRWHTLANIVYYVDNICSAKGLFDARIALGKSVLSMHLRTAYHQVIIRGVSTTVLHRAALESFQKEGWRPLLHFSDATLYVCSAADSKSEPLFEQIEKRMIDILKEATAKDVSQLMIGSPTANILPKPELFEFSEIRSYLKAATRKVGRKKFLTDYEREKKRVTNGNTVHISQGSKAKVIEGYWKSTGHVAEPYSTSMDWDAERISIAHPDMIAFKFFKKCMSREMVGDKGWNVAKNEYESVLGAGSWSDLLETSTLMPARDMAKTVDKFWLLSGSSFAQSVRFIEELSPDKRTELLIDTLSSIADKVYSSVSEPPSRAALAKEMAAGFAKDLVSPAPDIDLASLAKEQMSFYGVSKQFCGKQIKKASYICPICNTQFKTGIKASADFVDKPESHTNRGIAHGQFDYVVICKVCYYERLLRQLLLGERATELVIILPRMNIGPFAGELLMRNAQVFYDEAYNLMTGNIADPDRRLHLGFTSLIAQQVFDKDIYEAEPDYLINLIAYRSSEDHRQKNLRQLEKAIRDAYNNDLDEANTEWGTVFSSWGEALDSIYLNELFDSTVRGIRAEVYRLYPQMGLVCQTPHMVIMPVSYPIKFDKDSEANAALRRVYIALLIGLNLDVSVAIVANHEQIAFYGGEGVAYVSPVSAVRELIGSNWISLSEADRWFRRIGVASILANAGQYSERSGIFEVLVAPTAGHVLRRIEHKQAQEKRTLGLSEIKYLQAFDKLR